MFAHIHIHIRFIYLLRVLELVLVFSGIPLTFLFAVNEFNMFVKCQACRACKRLAEYEYEYFEKNTNFLCQEHSTFFIMFLKKDHLQINNIKTISKQEKTIYLTKNSSRIIVNLKIFLVFRLLID